MSMFNVIADAVKGGFCVSFTYDRKERVVQPHAIGWTKEGKEIFRALQTGGKASDQLPAWRSFHLDKVSDLQTQPSSIFNTAPDFNRGDEKINCIHLER